MTSFDFKDRKGVLFSLFAVGAVGSEVANRNDFNKVIVVCCRKLNEVVVVVFMSRKGPEVG